MHNHRVIASRTGTQVAQAPLGTVNMTMCSGVIKKIVWEYNDRTIQRFQWVLASLRS